MKETSINYADYQMACYNCGQYSRLVMGAHRNGNGDIVGWLFSCDECFPSIAGKNAELTFTDRHE